MMAQQEILFLLRFHFVMRNGRFPNYSKLQSV